MLGDLNPASLPPKHDLTVQWAQLGSKYSYVIDALQIADILTLDIASAIILNRGILTDIYDPPSASSPLDNQNVAAPVGIDQIRMGRPLRGRRAALPDLRLAERDHRRVERRRNFVAGAVLQLSDGGGTW